MIRKELIVVWRFIYALLIVVGFSVWVMTANDLMHGYVTIPSKRAGDVKVTVENLDIFITVIAVWVIVGCIFVSAGVYGFYLEKKHPSR